MGEMISGIPALDWGMIALSSFNTLLPIWLGLTILLNAERRTWGIWLAGGGMLFTGGFFIFHSALLEGSFFLLPFRLRSWWFAGWLPVIILPCGWYIAMLWFSGFWEKRTGALRRRHRIPLAIIGGLMLAVAGLFLATERPSITAYAYNPWRGGSVNLPEVIFAFNTPLPILIYGFYIILCLLFALDALRHLEPSERIMGDLARVRARPWLVATSAIQIGVAVVVAAAMLWMVSNDGARQNLARLVTTLCWFDLALQGMIAASMILLGEAVIRYEIFTGKILPRQGLRRHWRNALILAAGYGGAMGLALGLQLPQFSILLGTTILIAVFYALLNWRSYVERDRYLENLRPFIGSQRLYERMLSTLDSSRADGGVAAPFHALCSDVLGARLAYLVPLGPLAPLAGEPLGYPRGLSGNLPGIPELAGMLNAPNTLSVPLPPERYNGAVWGIPLWSERGLIGGLLLGEKLDGGLYTQEEIEIARASSERLIDLQAGAEMARRLVTLQRQRMAESQVVDSRTRRVLHDDLLPQIHTAMLSLSGTPGASEAIPLLADLHRRISDLLRDIPTPVAPNLQRLGVAASLRSMVEGELRDAFDEVEWEIPPDAEHAGMALSPLTAEVLYYAAREAIRNAARYGRLNGSTLRLRVSMHLDSTLRLAVEDNGPGIDPERPSEGGSGQGLALHGTMMAVVGGSLTVESAPGEFTRVVLTVPVPEG